MSIRWRPVGCQGTTRRLDGAARSRIPYPGMTTEPKVLIPDKHIDCIGLFCPMPIVKTREAIQVMSPGELLAMLSDDPASDADMRSWCQITGHELLEVSREDGVYRFLVRKNRYRRGGPGRRSRPGVARLRWIVTGLFTPSQ